MRKGCGLRSIRIVSQLRLSHMYGVYGPDVCMPFMPGLMLLDHTWRKNVCQLGAGTDVIHWRLLSQSKYTPHSFLFSLSIMHCCFCLIMWQRLLLYCHCATFYCSKYSLSLWLIVMSLEWLHNLIINYMHSMTITCLARNYKSYQMPTSSIYTLLNMTGHHKERKPQGITD